MNKARRKWLKDTIEMLEQAMLELVAEMTSAMLCSLVGIDTDKAFNNSVAYIDGWMKHLTDHKTEFVWAARRAEAAMKYIINEQ